VGRELLYESRKLNAGYKEVRMANGLERLRRKISGQAAGGLSRTSRHNSAKAILQTMQAKVKHKFFVGCIPVLGRKDQV